MQLQRDVLGLQPSTWAWAGAGFVVGLAIATVAWAIVAGKDAVAIVGDVLTFLTLVAAVTGLRYAAESARAARDTVDPLRAMAADLDAAAKTLQTNLRIAERTRQEQQYERIHTGLVRMRLARYPPEAREGQFVLRAALAAFPEDQLPACWDVARDLEPYGKLGERADRALAELQPFLDNAHKELDQLLAGS